jgi:ectoine hydroxylase-related dioxygenase (phytanoyl-CoA dioxygenase family)
MNLFRWARRDAERIRLQAQAHCRELHEEGVTRIRGGFAPGLVDDVLKSVKRTLKRNHEIFGRHLDADGHYPRIINLHALNKSLLRLFADNPLALAVQDAFFGAPSILYTSLYYERGSAQSIHRDTPYFSTRPEYRYLGVWVALEDAGDANGCLQVIRKAHLIPEFDRPAIALQYFKTLDEIPPAALGGQDVLWDAYQAKVMEACSARGLVVERIEAQAGDVIIWHPQLPHGGSPINDLTRTRHSFVMHVTPKGTPVYQQDVFFNPSKQVPEHALWPYGKAGDRKYVAFDSIDIGHREAHPLSDFVT